MLTARVDHKGRIVLPSEVRATLKLRAGDEVIFWDWSPQDVPGEQAFRVSKAVFKKA